MRYDIDLSSITNDDALAYNVEIKSIDFYKDRIYISYEYIYNGQTIKAELQFDCEMLNDLNLIIRKH